MDRDGQRAPRGLMWPRDIKLSWFQLLPFPAGLSFVSSQEGWSGIGRAAQGGDEVTICVWHFIRVTRWCCVSSWTGWSPSWFCGSVAAPVHGHSRGIRAWWISRQSQCHLVRENIIISTNLLLNSWDCRKCNIPLGSDIDVQGTVLPTKAPCVCVLCAWPFSNGK